MAYSLTPSHKAFLARLIRKYYPDDPSVLALGDSWNDALMFEEASISIELASSQVGPYAADLRVASLKTVTQLLEDLNVTPFTTPMKGILYAFYKAWLLTFVVFLCNALQLFIAENVMGSYFIFADSLLIVLGNAMILSYLDLHFSGEQMAAFPGLYCEGKILEAGFLQYCLRYPLVEAFLHALLIFFNTFFFSMTEIRIPNDLSNHLYLELYLSVALVSAFHAGMVARSRRVLIACCCVAWTLIIIVCVTFVDRSNPLNEYHITTYFNQLFDNFVGILSIFTNILLCLLVSCLYRFLLAHLSLLDIASGLADLNLNNDEILKHLEKKKRKIIDIAKHVFKKSNDIESSVV
jgi:magnesium-transporting ATPase (P-type)